MKHLFRQSTWSALGLALLLSLTVTAAAQQTRERSVKQTKKMADAASQASKAARVFEQVMDVPEKSVPKELLDKAEAIGVFPGVKKVGLGLGGRGGRGVISRREADGWSAPAFFNMGGASIGLQIGASSTDFVLLFMNDDALKGLLGDKFEIGGEGSVAAGPVGRAASASTDAQLKAGILSYSRTKGLFAGLELKGVVINPDNNDNEAVYSGMKASDILTGSMKMSMQEMPAGVRIFPQTLGRYSKR